MEDIIDIYNDITRVVAEKLREKNKNDIITSFEIIKSSSKKYS